MEEEDKLHDKDKTCLLIIDMQNGVFALKDGVFDADGILANAEKCIRHSLDNGIKVILTRHENKSFLRRNSEGWELSDSVDKYSLKAFILKKKHPSVYEDTGLHDYLRKNDVSDIYIGGLISNGCIREACLDSIKHGYKAHLIEDCHSTFYANAKKIIAEINGEMKKAGIHLVSASSFIES